jgi:transcriptional regulator
MYLPRHMRADEAQTAALLQGLRAAHLVSATASGLWATFMPMVHAPAPGGLGSLLGHVARRNEHWQLEPIGESLAILQGPDSYLTPNWYASKREHGRVVPTWAYVSAHVYGELVVHDDPEWLGRVVRLLTDKYEAGQASPWSVNDAPAAYISAQLRAIVGVELVISRIEAKAKLEQGEPAADIDGIVGGLERAGEHALAQAVSQAGRAPSSSSAR